MKLEGKNTNVCFSLGKKKTDIFFLLCLYVKCPLSLMPISFWSLLQEQMNFNIHLFFFFANIFSKASNLTSSLNIIFQLSAGEAIIQSHVLSGGLQWDLIGICGSNK